VDVLLRPPGFGENEGLFRRPHLFHLRETTFERLTELPGLAFQGDGAGSGDKALEEPDLPGQLDGVGFPFGAALAAGIALLDVIALQLLPLNKAIEKTGVGLPAALHQLQAVAHGGEGAGDRIGGGGEQLAQDKDEEMALLAGHGQGLLTGEIFGEPVVERLFRLVRGERDGDGAPFSVLDVLGDLTAQGAFAKGGEPFAEFGVVGFGSAETAAEGRDLAENVVVDEGGQPVEFEQ